MKPVDQTLFGEGVGNCFSASVASLLELPIDEVPSFCADAEHWPHNFEAWVRQRGYSFFDLHLWSDPEWHPAEGQLCELAGRSPRGEFDHSVVGQYTDGKYQIVHDPHPSRDGLEGEPKTAMFLIPLNPIVCREDKMSDVPVFEYKLLNLSWNSTEDIQNILNKLSKDGWVFCSEIVNPPKLKTLFRHRLRNFFRFRYRWHLWRYAVSLRKKFEYPHVLTMGLFRRQRDAQEVKEEYSKMSADLEYTKYRFEEHKAAAQKDWDELGGDFVRLSKLIGAPEAFRGVVMKWAEEKYGGKNAEV